MCVAVQKNASSTWRALRVEVVSSTLLRLAQSRQLMVFHRSKRISLHLPSSQASSSPSVWPERWHNSLPPFSPRRSTRQEFHVSCKMSVQFREEKLRKISWERFLQLYEELDAVQKQSEICAQQKPNAAITPRKNIDDTHANTPTNERKRGAREH